VNDNRAHRAGDGIKDGMQLVQWVVLEPTGGFRTLLAPVWAESVPAQSEHMPALRRRSAPLASRWLAHPLAIAALEDGSPPPNPAAALGAQSGFDVRLKLHLRFAVADRGPPLTALRDDDLGFFALMGEMLRVVADLCESAGLPLLSITPDAERRGVVLQLGSLATLPPQTAFDALVLFRVAADLCAQARGFVVADAIVTTPGARSSPLDARAVALFAEVR
jgi:hypothetical protein